MQRTSDCPWRGKLKNIQQPHGQLPKQDMKRQPPIPRQQKTFNLAWADSSCSRGQMAKSQMLHPLLFPFRRAACGYIGAPSCLFSVTGFCGSCFVSCLCVYIFFIPVHHPGSKIKRSDSSSSISSQSPIGWLLCFVPLPIHPGPLRMALLPKL